MLQSAFDGPSVDWTSERNVQESDWCRSNDQLQRPGNLAEVAKILADSAMARRAVSRSSPGTIWRLPPATALRPSRPIISSIKQIKCVIVAR